MSCHSWLHSYDFISSEYIDSGIAASTHRDRPKRNMDNWIIEVLAGPRNTTEKTDSTTKKDVCFSRGRVCFPWEGFLLLVIIGWAVRIPLMMTLHGCSSRSIYWDVTLKLRR